MEFKIAIRNLVKRPFLNAVKVIGLSLAFSGTAIILLFLLNQLSFDHSHKNADRIYRLTTTGSDSDKHFAKIFDPLYLPKMPSYFPQVENYVRLAPIMGGVLKYNEEFIKVSQAFQCDSTFFQVFDSPLVKGNPERIFEHPASAVLSESFAEKVFGKTDPIGQTITLPAGQFYGSSFDFIVRGVMKDFPQNSHFHPEFITTPADKTELDRVAWTYLLLRPESKADNITERFGEFYSTQVDKNPKNKQTAYLQKITDIHLHSNKLREIESNSSMSVIYTFSIAALLLLSIAFINFFNLSMGMSVFSEKYLRFSKILGSTKWTATRYFFYESALIGVVAIAISILLTLAADAIITANFSLRLLDGNWTTIGLTMGAFVVLMSISAALLSFRQSLSFRATGKNQVGVQRKNVSMGLVVLQNVISICLIVAVIVIYRQTNYSLSNSMGADSENMICFKNVHSDVQGKFETFKSELLKSTSIKSVSAMLDTPGGEANDMMPFTLEGYVANESDKNDNLIGVLPCDYSFAGIFNLKFIGGQNFSEKNTDHEGSGEYIINEAAMKRLGYTSAEKIIGKEFGISFDPSIPIPKGRIIGVVTDFHLSSMKRKIEPLVLFKRENLWLLNFLIAFQPGNETQGLSDLDKAWKKMFAGHPMEYDYVNHLYENVYETELLEADLLSLFTGVALLIGAMGLMGLSLLVTQRRLKEIAIRKVNGAKVSQLIAMLSWNFTKWIIVAFTLAVPIALFAMSKWLEPFAYKTEMSWWIFVVAGLAAVVVTFISVLSQSLKATTINPIEILRHE